jgi:hypothetical protein
MMHNKTSANKVNRCVKLKGEKSIFQFKMIIQPIIRWIQVFPFFTYNQHRISSLHFLIVLYFGAMTEDLVQCVYSDEKKQSAFIHRSTCLDASVGFVYARYHRKLIRIYDHE